MNLLSLKTRKALSRLIHSDKYKEFYINLALRIMQGDTIGVENGDCFRRVRCSLKIAVDPYRTLAFEKLCRGELFFEVESDRFFSDYAEGLFSDRRIDVALVDGLHEYH